MSIILDNLIRLNKSVAYFCQNKESRQFSNVISCCGQSGSLQGQTTSYPAGPTTRSAFVRLTTSGLDLARHFPEAFSLQSSQWQTKASALRKQLHEVIKCHLWETSLTLRERPLLFFAWLIVMHHFVTVKWLQWLGLLSLCRVSGRPLHNMLHFNTWPLKSTLCN